MVTRLKLALPQDEYSALLKMALAELRNPSDQIRHIVRHELQAKGLLPADLAAPPPATPKPEKEADHAPAAA